GPPSIRAIARKVDPDERKRSAARLRRGLGEGVRSHSVPLTSPRVQDSFRFGRGPARGGVVDVRVGASNVDAKARARALAMLMALGLALAFALALVTDRGPWRVADQPSPGP